MKIKIYEDKNFDSQEELFKAISNDLLKQNLVKDSFAKAVMDREEKFPTGLRGKIRNIAIPHADPINVNESAYVVVLNNKSLKFSEMGNKDNKLDVNLIVFILSDSESGHMGLLQKTINLANVEQKLTAESINKLLTS